MIDEEKQASKEMAMMHQVQETTKNPQELEADSEQDFDVYGLQELLEDHERFLEYAMEDKERPEKRRKVESDKGDGVLPVPNRSPIVVLNKIKLKEDVLERLRKIKKLAQAKVKESSLPTANVSEKEVKESKTEQDNSTQIENKADDTCNERKQKRKREDDDVDQEEQETNVAKIARVNSEPVAKETLSICESVEKEDPDRVASEEQIVAKRSGEYDDKEEEKLVGLEDKSSVEGYIPNSEEASASIATQSKGDEVSKAAQNYAKSGAQTEPKQDKLVIDDKLVVVVTEVLEEGNSRSQEDSVISEQESHVDNNNCGEQEETLSDEVKAEDDDFMSNAIYQLIKDVIKNRTEYFEGALLRENEKLEERVSQLEKQNALLQRVGYRLDYALKEITRKRQEKRQSCISRGTQVNMNLNLSRTSTSKSTTIEIDVPEEAENKTGSPQPKSNSTISEGKNSPRLLTSTSKQSPIPSETISSKAAKEKAASSTSTSSTARKSEENRPTDTKSGENKSSSGSEGILVSQSNEPAKKVSTTQQHEQQDPCLHKKLQPGMGHFRLSPSYKRAAQQQSTKEDTIETGHFRITPAGLEPQYSPSSQRHGKSLVNEPLRAQVTTRPSSASPRVQKMDTPSQNVLSNSNSSCLAVSSSTLTKNQPRSPSFSQAVTQEERRLSVPVSPIATKNAAPIDLVRRSHNSSTVTVPARSSPLSNVIPQEKRKLSAPPSLINTKTTRVDDLERKSQTSSTSTVPTVSRASPLSPNKHRTFAKEPSGLRTISTENIENIQQRKESANADEPDIVIVSHTTISSPKEQPKKVLRNEKVGSQVEISGPHVQNSNEKQAQVRIHRVENQTVSQEGPQSSNRQRPELMRTLQLHIQQNSQGVNHQSSSNQQLVYRSHDASRVSTAPRDVPPLRSNEPQQHVRYMMREDRSRLQMVQEQPRQVDKGQHDPRQPPRHVVQEARGQPQVVREQALRPTDKTLTSVRCDPQQSRYIIQERPPHRVHEHSPRSIVHEGTMQARHPVPQQALPPGVIVVQQQHQGSMGSSAESKAIGPRPPPIGIQDVRTQTLQPYSTQQQPQQHIIVKQHPQVQNPQHPHQYQQSTYQYQQPQHRPTLPQQQNVPRIQAPVYYPPQTLQQVRPQMSNPQTAFQPRPTVLPQDYATSSRIPPERATVKSNVSVGGPVRPRQQPPVVVYQPGVLEGSAVRPAAPMPPHGYDRYQPRQVLAQQGRQPQNNNQGIPRPMTEPPMPRPPSQGGARYAQALEQQRIQERRAQGEKPPQKTQTSPAVGRRDSVPRQPSPPKPTASIAIVENGIVLSWNITSGESTENIECYELFACQDDSNSTLPPILWKKIGVVKALPLPMACTLTQFSSGSRYQFAVRAVDTSERAGPFSDPCVITLKR